MVGEATIDMKVFEEETFGPLMAVFKFKSEKECKRKCFVYFF